jgi:glycosyltransferase involved in cell wall biosynthesis
VAESGRALHIGVDARELLGRPTGVGRYLSELLKSWASSSTIPHRFTLFSNADAPSWIGELGPRFTCTIEPDTRGGTRWEQMVLPRLADRDGIDVLFAPGYTAPIRLKTPSVLVVHDVSFFAHPEWFPWREGFRRRWLTRAAARRARTVITVSEFSAGEIVRYLGVPTSRVVVVPHGAPACRFHEKRERLPIVLFVGSLFNRRRIPELIAGFARARRRVAGARLVLVGDNRTAPPLDPREVARSVGVADSVEWLEYVPDEELDRLYSAARVFAFLSDYEGFAMTPLEALAHGVPSVLLDTAVAREIYQGAARFVPADEDAIGDALVALLSDEDERTRLLDEGRRLLARHSWNQAATDVIRVLETAARK